MKRTAAASLGRYSGEDARSRKPFVSQEPAPLLVPFLLNLVFVICGSMPKTRRAV